jgi:hypothetical protein
MPLWATQPYQVSVLNKAAPQYKLLIFNTCTNEVGTTLQLTIILPEAPLSWQLQTGQITTINLIECLSI